jgi:hypothetical protein
MSETTMTKALVFTLLRHAEDFPWRMQDIGLMGLRLDERREYRLQPLEPELERGGPAHTRPPLYDFTSAIIVGELTNTRYVRTLRATNTSASDTRCPTRSSSDQTR